VQNRGARTVEAEAGGSTAQESAAGMAGGFVGEEAACGGGGRKPSAGWQAVGWRLEVHALPNATKKKSDERD
jgi:hypothetical protein